MRKENVFETIRGDKMVFIMSQLGKVKQGNILHDIMALTDGGWWNIIDQRDTFKKQACCLGTVEADITAGGQRGPRQMFILTIWLQSLCNIASKDSYITRFAFKKLYRQRCHLRHPSITLWHHSQTSLNTVSERYIRNICALWTWTRMTALQWIPAFEASVVMLFERGVDSTLVFLWSQSHVAVGFLLVCNLKSVYYVWFLKLSADTDLRTACLTLNEIIYP